jgi:hypothetical protein
MAPAVRRPAQRLAVRCRRRVRDQLPHAAGRDAAGVRRAQTGRRTEAGRARLHRHQPGRGDVHLGRGRTALRLRRRLSRAAGRPARHGRGRGRNCGRLRQHRLLGNAAAGFRRRVAALRRLPFRQPARRAGSEAGRQWSRRCNARPAAAPSASTTRRCKASPVRPASACSTRPTRTCASCKKPRRRRVSSRGSRSAASADSAAATGP